jgi:hypothetical protein
LNCPNGVVTDTGDQDGAGNLVDHGVFLLAPTPMIPHLVAKIFFPCIKFLLLSSK